MSLGRWVVALLIVMGGALRTSQAQEPVVLRHKFTKGDSLIYKTIEGMKQSQTVMGMKVASSINQEAIQLRVVELVDSAGKVTVKVKTEQRKMNADFGMLGKYVFDSKAKDNDKTSTLGTALTPLLERLTGSEYRKILDSTGKVGEVKGYTELVADLIKANPLTAQLGGAADDAELKSREQQSLIIFGDKALKAGEKWSVPVDVALGKVGKQKGNTVYTYEGPDKVGNRKTVRIGIVAESAIDIDTEQGGAKVTGTLKSTKSGGTAQFDPAAGRIVSLKQSTTFAGKLNVNVGGMMIPIDNEQEQTVSVELLDKLP